MSDDGMPPPPPPPPSTPDISSGTTPTPGGSVPPPPPPPGLSSPPGYVAYQNAPTPAGHLKRIGGLSKGTMITTGIAGIAGVASAATLAPVLGKASGFLDGTVTEDEFNDAYLSSQLLSTLQTVIGLAAGVLTILWMYRIASNLRVFSRRTTFHPVLSIFGWLLPPFLFVLPFLILRELWKASDPDTPVGDDGWRSQPVTPLLSVWFVVYGVIPGVLSAIVAYSTVQSLFDDGFPTSDNARVTAESLESAGQFTVASGVITLVGAVVWIVFVKQLTARHVELTGET